MKILLTLFLFLTLTSFKVFSQSNENEIVLASEEFNINNIQQIKQLLQTKEGFLYKGFCEEHHFVLFLIENEAYTVKSLISLINHIIPEQSILIKEGGFDAAYKVCSDKEKMHLK